MSRPEAIPAYHRLYVLMSEGIRSGAYRPGVLLPSEAELTRRHGVSRVTVRRALDLLVQDGLVEKQRGRGSMVAVPRREKAKQPPLSNAILNRVIGGAGLDVETLSWEKVDTPAFAAGKLQIKVGADSLLIKRLRRYNGQPVSVSSIYLPGGIAAVIDRNAAEGRLIVELLDACTIKPERAEHKLSATLANGDAARLLQVETGSPLLRMQGIVYGDLDRPLYFQDSVYHPGRYEYVVNLNRSADDEQGSWWVAN